MYEAPTMCWALCLVLGIQRARKCCSETTVQRQWHDGHQNHGQRTGSNPVLITSWDFLSNSLWTSLTGNSCLLWGKTWALEHQSTWNYKIYVHWNSYSKMLRNTEEPRSQFPSLLYWTFLLLPKHGVTVLSLYLSPKQGFLGVGFQYSQVYQEISPDLSKVASSLLIRHVGVTWVKRNCSSMTLFQLRWTDIFRS